VVCSSEPEFVTEEELLRLLGPLLANISLAAIACIVVRPRFAVMLHATQPGQAVAAVVNYQDWRRGVDPFAVVRTLQPVQNSGHLQPLELPQRLEAFTIQQLQARLVAQDQATLLGAAQALLDGSRVAFPAENAADICETLWLMLPYRERTNFSFCTACAAPLEGYKFLGLVDAAAERPPGLLRSDKLADYPEGRYEAQLQWALEHADDNEYQRLMQRRTSAETLRLAMTLLGGMVLVLLAMKFLG